MTMTASKPKGSWRSDPISQAQVGKINALLAERDLTGTAYVGWEPDWAKATKGMASSVIDFLLTLPKAAPAKPVEVTEAEATHDEFDEQPPAVPTQKFGAAWAAIPVGSNGYGYYALEVGPDQHKFFRVERPTEGKWEGMTFIKEQASDSFYPVEPKPRGYSYLTEIASDPENAGLLYGQQIGKCTRCHRTLTDVDSRAIGIGPDCLRKGW